MKQPKRKRKSKSKTRDAKSNKLYNEILEIVSTILESSQNTTVDSHITKLEYLKTRLTEELKENMNSSVKANNEESFFSEISRSTCTAQNKPFKVIEEGEEFNEKQMQTYYDNISANSETITSEFNFEKRFDQLFGKLTRTKIQREVLDSDLLSMLQVQAKALEFLKINKKEPKIEVKGLVRMKSPIGRMKMNGGYKMKIPRRRTSKDESEKAKDNFYNDLSASSDPEPAELVPMPSAGPEQPKYEAKE
uniref:Uncharacterized protein n=1 Tax=Euplotes crassus TaxID=5936 RepID=A0A7S3NT98_EUPCR|mmetsp:Transcript_18055/g.17774  ORF Transcript_18055/g.17774 Transcript_18055/m.17774 type:complete len:249 (+) Transcript_18055:160-906(+)